MTENLKSNIERTFRFSLNKNQWKDIQRLIYEIYRRDNLKYETIINELKKDRLINRTGGSKRFSIIKQNLIKMRFPLTSLREKIDTKNVFLAELKKPLKSNSICLHEFKPEQIFVEKRAKGSYLLGKFKEKFPDVKINELNYCGEYIKEHKFLLKDLKKPLVFIVKERWDFIKPCPCTKGYLGCNYWIFNLGMGCPFDCSYCFLQAYSNFPGIVLPSNLDDFFNKFDDFFQKINRPIRIGTGEFCDSLALDDITGYSLQLIDFFKDKPVYFELKTKSSRIKNIVKSTATANVVISWSINPQAIIDSEEIGTSSLKERLQAAREIQQKGNSLAFHFDPIIHSPRWQQLYKETIDKLYEHLKPPFKWISLGTLRGSRELKNAAEQRFPKSRIFYGEFFIGQDKKIRYPKFLRKEIYRSMVRWIRKYDKKTPLYLCMEDSDVWKIIGSHFNSSKYIEKYIINTH